MPESPVLAHEGGDRLLDLVRVMQKLRGPGGCPWDAEQTHQTLARHLLEEAHEAIEAIDADDLDRLRDELGDVLLQVVFHAELGRQEGSFDVDDVAEGVVRKLIRRHPHVFGDVRVGSAAEVLVNWEQIKKEEKGREHPVDEEIPETMPALARAAKVQRRAAGEGLDWRSTDAALAALREDLARLERDVRDESPVDRLEAVLGDVLFAAAAVGRRVGLDPETALRKAARRFSDRVERARERSAAEGFDPAALGDEDLAAWLRPAGDDA